MKTLEEIKAKMAEQYLKSNLMKVPESNVWLHFRNRAEPSDIIYALEMVAEKFAAHVWEESCNECEQSWQSGTLIEKVKGYKGPFKYVFNKPANPFKK